MIYDVLNEMRDQGNGQGLYWNYFYHVWKTFSVSPFANAAVMVPGAPSITSVTVSPSEAVVTQGQSIKLSATVVTTGFANKAVTWSVATETSGAEATIDLNGVLTISADTPAEAEFTVTATSIYDTTKTGTATVTTPEAGE